MKPLRLSVVKPATVWRSSQRMADKPSGGIQPLYARARLPGRPPLLSLDLTASPFIAALPVRKKGELIGK